MTKFVSVESDSATLWVMKGKTLRPGAIVRDSTLCPKKKAKCIGNRAAEVRPKI